ncbi:response regulator transcription factor [Sphingomonas sp. CL5.1]|uniref:response regulator transcription factor n=1 Tax=Sphingomonas sp. CL5.1 TaxID=2653203 RepID=UPI0015821166|nr:response regulator transcription factor [Sphingomonas sp. CL5.1]QKR99769.1 response regulator transcription factor [Sphingomonas sp. CL5.1]
MHIALVDDDETMLDMVRHMLEEQGHRCFRCRSGRELMTALQRETFDLLIVDWNMPEMSGLEIIERVRSHLADPPPILMLTRRSDKDDIAHALNAGADDFIVKPETPVVFAARVNALLRRRGGESDTGTLQFGPYRFDRVRDKVVFREETIALTSKEYALALLFFRNLNRALSRAYIMEFVWKSVADLSTRTLDMHVSRIRAKLSLRPENGFFLRTVFGYGYRLESAHAED